MLDSTTRKNIDDCRDILVGKVPDPRSQIDQITVALIYKFMHDMDQQAVELGGKAGFFAKHTEQVNGKDEVKDFAQYAWPRLMAKELGGEERVRLYAEALEKMPENPGLPPLFRAIFKQTFLPYRDPATLREFLKGIDKFTYDHSEKLGDAFEYLLSIMGSQGDAGQFRTPRHLIDFMAAVIDPQKHETILDPACGTAGFLISAYKHIVAGGLSVVGSQLSGGAQQANGQPKRPVLTPDDRKRLVGNIVGYDIDPGMVKLALVNLYLHGFPDPHIHEYDTLTSTDRWEERFDVVLANPPFMSPKGGIRPHGKFGIPSTRSEVLFVDYIAEHLHPNGRALVVVPEGIIFQSGKAYKALRKKLVDEHYLVGVVSIPSGVFNPYAGVKTSLLWFDRALARKTDQLLFVKVEADGFDLGAQRRPIAQNDLPAAYALLMDYKRALKEGGKWQAPEGWETKALQVPRSAIGAKDEYVLSGDRYATSTGVYDGEHVMVPLGELCEVQSGYPFKSELFNTEEGFPLIRIRDIKPNRTVTKYTGTYEKDFVVENGDLLIGMDGEFNTALWAGGPALLNQRVCRLHSFSRVMKEYVYLLIQKKLKEIEVATYAVTVKHLSVKQIKAIEIPLPPLSEQKALVAEVEGYQRVIDGARQVVAHYKPRITIDPEWEMVELGEVCENIYTGPFGTVLHKSDYVVDGIPLINPQNIGDGVVIPDGAKHVSRKTAERLNEYRLRTGDVIIGRRGEMGRCALITEEMDGWLCGTGCFFIRLKGQCNPTYIAMQLGSTEAKAYLEQQAVGVTMLNLNTRILSSITIPLPPLAEQERIVAELEEERCMVEAAKALAARMEARVKERVAQVWGSGSSVAARPAAHSFGIAQPDTPADDQTLIASPPLAPSGNGHAAYAAPEAAPMAAEPLPVAERRGRGRPPKQAPATGQGSAEAAIHNWLQAHPGLHARSAILAGTGVEATAWNAAIKALLEAGQVERQGEKKGARYGAVWDL